MSTIKLSSVIFFYFYSIPLSIIELVETKWAHLWALTIVNDGVARDGHDGHGTSIFCVKKSFFCRLQYTVFYVILHFWCIQAQVACSIYCTGNCKLQLTTVNYRMYDVRHQSISPTVLYKTLFSTVYSTVQCTV